MGLDALNLKRALVLADGARQLLLRQHGQDTHGFLLLPRTRIGLDIGACDASANRIILLPRSLDASILVWLFPRYDGDRSQCWFQG